MKKKYQSQKNNEAGNALIYVLVAIVLFAALSFTLTRQTDTDEAGYLSGDQAELYASEIIAYAAAAKSTVDQMLFTGSSIDDLDFILPGDAAFDTGSNFHKVFHPLGGGLNYRALRDEMVSDNASFPAGIYAVKKNVEWTESTATDVILSFYRLQGSVCDALADKIDGNLGIPIGPNMFDVFTDQADANTLDNSYCPLCIDQFTYVITAGSPSFVCTFYTILVDR